MPVNTDDGLHVAGDGPRLVRACCRLGVWFLACMPQRSPGSSVTSGTSTTTALIPTGWPSTADPESPSEDEPGGRGPPGPSSGADAGQRSRLPVAPPTVSDFASRVSWLIGHSSLLRARLVPELCPSCYLASGQGKLGNTNSPVAGHSLRDGAKLSVTDK